NEINHMGLNCNPVPGGAPWYNTANASAAYATAPVMSWKWTRITAKTNQISSGTTTATVDGTNGHANWRVCWNGVNQVVTNLASCAAATYQPVYLLTSLAVTPSGSRRMVQGEATFELPNFP